MSKSSKGKSHTDNEDGSEIKSNSGQNTSQNPSLKSLIYKNTKECFNNLMEMKKIWEEKKIMAGLKKDLAPLIITEEEKKKFLTYMKMKIK